MPLEGYECPDGELVGLDSCFTSCRMGERCLTLPTLTAMGEGREWNGVPSTTQLINGTMYEFLKITKPYFVDPDTRAFMLQGTKHHAQMEEVAKSLGLAAEIPLSVDRDIFDLLEWENGELALTDRKMWGSFKVAKALGLVEVGKRPDPSGAKYKVSGKHGKAGDPKMVVDWGIDRNKADTWEANLQLNRYRIMLWDLGLRPGVTKLRLEVLVRDGGLYVAKDRGVWRNMYQIPIPIMPDDEVREYFQYKEDNLLRALDIGSWDMPCDGRESWDGARCAGYCEVWEYCTRGRIAHGGV